MSATAAASTVLGVLIGNNWSVIIAALTGNAGRFDQAFNAYEFARQLLAQAKGDAGVVATAAAALALFWPPLIPLTIVGIGLVLLVRYSAVASMLVWIAAAPGICRLMSIMVSAIVPYVLIPNMKGLRAGTEQRFGQRIKTK